MGTAAAKAAPDGHTILVWGSIAAANALYTKLPYDTLRDFTPVAALGQTPLVVVTGVGRFKSLSELVSTAKANPGKLNYATVGVGSAAHFGTEQLAVSAGFSAKHVPFKGGEWLTEVIAGRLDFAVTPVTSAIGLIRDGKLVHSQSARRRVSLHSPMSRQWSRPELKVTRCIHSTQALIFRLGHRTHR